MRKKDNSEIIRSYTGTCPERENRKRDPFTLPVIILAVLVGIYLLFEILRTVKWSDLSGIGIFNTIMTGILMQAFPFMLIGVLISSAMHVFVPDDWLIRIFPIKYGLGFLTAMFAGLLFPVCECAIVPVMTRLIKKGVAPPIAITFMLSAPIINPIVIISTLYAFPNQPEVALYRVCFGLGIALLIGLVMLVGGGSKAAILRPQDSDGDDCTCCCCAHNQTMPAKMTHKVRDLFLISGDEFFSVGKYLIIGAFFTSLIRVLVPDSAFKNLTGQDGLSLLLMMSAAFLFSACSTSDAFIARSFMNQMPMGAIMGFLVFGPMMDVKNILMLFANFKKSFVLKLSLLIFILNFVTLYFFAFWLF
ncbi:MAG: permease [Oscillospiraceae bacterium]